jgi:amidase
LSVPAGFTDDGLPVAVDLLGGPFKEQELLSLGFSIGETLKLRRAPFSTPALVAGRRPTARKTTAVLETRATSSLHAGIRAVVDFDFDPTTSQLSYALRIDPAGRDEVMAIWIHAGTPAKPGAARHQLYGPSRSMSGSVLLSAADRKDIMSGTLLLRLYVRNQAGSGSDVPLSFR